MEQMLGKDNKKSTRRRKNAIFKEASLVNDEHTFRADQLKGNDGELPLFFSSSSPHLSSKGNDLNFDHELVEPKWPFGSQESGSWASSFRFELDTQDDERLQAILKQDEQIPIEEANMGQKLTNCQSLMDSSIVDNRSFRFGENEELQNGHQYGKLKSSKQLGSFGFTSIFNANESQGYDIVTQSVGGSLNDAPTRIKVAMNDHVIASPRREVLQRLHDLKAHPSSPRFSLEDNIVSYQKEKAKINVVKDDIQQLRLKTLLKNEYFGKGISKPISQYHCKPQANMSSELEIMEFKEKSQRRSCSLPSELQSSLQKTLEPLSPMHSTTLTLRFKEDKMQLHGDECSKQNEVVVNNIDDLSLDHIHSNQVAIPFTWENELGKSKTIAAAMDRVLAHQLSRDGIEFMELQLNSQKGDVNSSIENGHFEKGIGPEALLGLSLSSSTNVDQQGGSQRYYGRDYLKGLSREASSRRYSTSKRHSTSEKEALIDLDGSAAAKFLVEAFESPSRSHGSSPTFLVPFKWEDAPGKAKVETRMERPNSVLQLPPRLALPSLSRLESFSSPKHRASSSFSGFFLPCLAAPVPLHRKEFTSSYNLPPRLLNPPVHLTRLGLVSRCSSTPKEGCQVWMSKSETSFHINSKKSLIESQLSPTQICTDLSTSELKIKSSEPSSPTNIVCGPNKYHSQTSGSSIIFSSGDLEDFTIQTQKSTSKSSSNTSYEYIEENVVEFPEVATTNLAIDIGLLNRKGAPTSSGYLNSQREPLALGTLTTLQSKTTSSSPQASPKQPSRLPYTMPSVAEQFLVSCGTSSRRQLLQDLSPKLLHQLSSRRRSRSHSSANISYQHLTSASHEKIVSPSPTYTTSRELFSSSTNQQIPKALISKPPPTRPRRRIRLMSSIFKTLKRAFGKKRRRLKRSEPMLTYIDDGKSPVLGFPLKTT